MNKPRPSKKRGLGPSPVSEPILMERYFIVFYTGIGANGQFNGQVTLITNGFYINQRTAISKIKEECKHRMRIILTNIIELNESDYKNWSIE